jgi:hypothetical protein
MIDSLISKKLAKNFQTIIYIHPILMETNYKQSKLVI